VVALSFVSPLVVEPVFNRFTPMPAGDVRELLLGLAATAGVPISEVLVADASRRTSALNAYVSGFGRTRRIVVYDTTLGATGPAELGMIVAHELGHARRHDVLRGTVYAALTTAVGIVVLGRVCSWPPLLHRAGASALGDPRSLALLMLVGLLGTLGCRPVLLAVSRRIEVRADLHALNLTADPRTFVALQRRLAIANLSELYPHPVRHALSGSHPTAPQRIAAARAWAAAHDGSAR
jgi:STE24 endopeptidase